MTDVVQETFLDRALRNLRVGWREIARATPVFGEPALHPDLPREDAEEVREQMRACLETRGGEVSARARAALLGESYLSLSRKGRRRFLEVLARDFGTDHDAVAEAAQRLAANGLEPEGRERLESDLRRALVAPRVMLLTQFNALPEGVKFLVDMRADLLSFLPEVPDLRGLENDLRDLLRSWFDVGFLDMRQIGWQSPAALLEKLIAYEAVHEIEGWEDLKNRLDSDRRCFAFFHNRMPDEPLIFVEVALVDSISGNIQELLDTSAPVIDPQTARTAIFYSISNAQKGLAGISFGGFLIKRVVDHLSAEFKSLRQFATLSPIPGLMSWLREELNEDAERVFSDDDLKAMRKAGLADGGAEETIAFLGQSRWYADETLADRLRTPLTRACARYLVHARRRDGRARDPVANFHLTNGARVETLNWLADTSEKGLRQSAGLMVNYLYRLDRIETNHEAYRGKGEIAASSTVRSLARD